jgi:hypothetical protein
MTAKKKMAQRPKSSKAKINVAALYPGSVVSMAARNLINLRYPGRCCSGF